MRLIHSSFTNKPSEKCKGREIEVFDDELT